jgi:hypothetical protein
LAIKVVGHGNPSQELACCTIIAPSAIALPDDSKNPDGRGSMDQSILTVA